MKSVTPFGNPTIARVFMIGHDPRLQNSKAEATAPFFMDMLHCEEPKHGPEKSKYRLAKAVWDYANRLTSCELSLDDLYVTNVCNEFLDHLPGSGTVLIPTDKALHGVNQIEEAVKIGHFKIIIPMSVQTFFYLCKYDFVEKNLLREKFLSEAAPRDEQARSGIYVQSGKAPFLNVCGKRFYHRTIPVVPVLHIKQWPINNQARRYIPLMDMAREEIIKIMMNN